MKTPQALLTAIAAAALSFAVVIGTAAMMGSQQDTVATSASVAQESLDVTSQHLMYVAQPGTPDWNKDCELAL